MFETRRTGIFVTMRALSSSPPTPLEWALTGRTCAWSFMPRCRERWRPTTRRRAAPAGMAYRRSVCSCIVRAMSPSTSSSTGNRSSRCRPTGKASGKGIGSDQLDLMRRYAYGAGCRQQAIMDYFGDADTLPEGCGRCDNCQTPDALPVDPKTQETVRILLSGAARLDGRFGGSQLADLVTGSDTAQIRRYDHDQLPTYGRLRSMSKRQVQAMIQALIRQGYLRQEGLRYPVLAITDEGREVMHNRAVARLGTWQPAVAKKSRPEPSVGHAHTPAPFTGTEEHAELREALRGLACRQSPRDGCSALYDFLGPHAR